MCEREGKWRKKRNLLFCLLIIVSLCLLANDVHTSSQSVIIVFSASFSITVHIITDGPVETNGLKRLEVKLNLQYVLTCTNEVEDYVTCFWGHGRSNCHHLV